MTFVVLTWKTLMTFVVIWRMLLMLKCCYICCEEMTTPSVVTFLVEPTAPISILGSDKVKLWLNTDIQSHVTSVSSMSMFFFHTCVLALLKIPCVGHLLHKCCVEITSGRPKDHSNVWSVQEHSLATSFVKRLTSEILAGPETTQGARSPTTRWCCHQMGVKIEDVAHN